MFYQSITLNPFEKNAETGEEYKRPCLTPTVVLNHFRMLLFIRNVLVDLSQSELDLY